MQYKLLNTSIRRIELINELKAEGQVDLSANYNTEISLNEENRRIAIAKARFDMSGGLQSETTSYLKIELSLDGVFEFDEEVENVDALKKNVHAAMFPYVRAYITTVTSLAGLPPITLPDMSMISE